MPYTVKELSEMAGVSVRTLHYYDEIDLLKPSFLGENSYRYYTDAELLRLQQVLFYRELGFRLKTIKKIIDKPDFDVIAALHEHRRALQGKVRRLKALIKTVDRTILNMTGEVEMSKNQLFTGFSKEEEEYYSEEARKQYSAEEVDASYKRWNNYSAEQKEKIVAEGQAIYQDLANAMPHGAGSPEVQQIIRRWHQHLSYFYEPSIARLRGLGQLYVDSPDFAEKFRQLDSNLPEFMRKAINHYCDILETK